MEAKVINAHLTNKKNATKHLPCAINVVHLPADYYQGHPFGCPKSVCE